MRIAVTGNSGQVVTCLLERGRRAGHDLVALGRPALDLTDPASVLRAVRTAAPDAVVSAAAYTAVDKAESEPKTAIAVNEAGAAAVAEAACSLNVPLIHLSTDYVFDGTLDRPYRETDPTGPGSVYGASKLAGEKAVLAAYPANSAVIRTAWVYSPFGGNFVKTMLRLAETRDEIAVVADQHGNPTSAFDIADGILRMLENLAGDDSPALRGVFHMTAQGQASWADFAEGIFENAAKRGSPFARVRRIPTTEYPTPAGRPANSRLDCERIAQIHNIVLPRWQDALDVVMARLHPQDRVSDTRTDFQTRNAQT